MWKPKKIKGALHRSVLCNNLETAKTLAAECRQRGLSARVFERSVKADMCEIPVWALIVREKFVKEEA